MKKFLPGKYKQKHQPVPKPDSNDGLRNKLQPRTLILVYSVIIAVCFIFYGNTITLRYALDDMLAITGNQFTKQGFKGIGEIMSTDFFSGFYGKGDNNIVSGGRYRPLSLITYAVEYQFFGENPAVNHFINVLLLSLTGILIFSLFWRLLNLNGNPPDKRHWYFSVPFLVSILFIAHPIHTEAIANIKGRDEILSLLGSLLTLLFILRYYEKGNVLFLLCSGIAFFLALLSKENAVTFIAIVPLTAYFFTRYPLKKIGISLIPLMTAFIIFFLIRQSVTGHHSSNPLENDLMNNPFVGMTAVQKFATVFYTLGLYLKLLIFPHPLTYDYYPYHIPIINWNDVRAIAPLVIYFILVLYAVLRFRQKGVIVYGIIYYLVTLSIVSNLLFPVGVFMNERFLYMPSLGFCLIISWILIHEMPRVMKKPVLSGGLVAGIVVILLSLYAVKTISRNRDWYDSYTLFTTDVKVSKNSAKGNECAGEYILQKAGETKDKAKRDELMRQSIRYQQNAIRIYPKQIVALLNLAAAYYQYNQDYDTILTVYKTILHYIPGDEQVYGFINAILDRYPDVEHKIRLYTGLYQVDPNRFDVNLNLGQLYLSTKNKSDIPKAIPFLETASKLDAASFNAQYSLGIAYGLVQRWGDALKAFEAAEKINPDHPDLLNNLAVVHQNLGHQEKAKQYIKRYKQAVQKK
jgi:hypothetical protein